MVALTTISIMAFACGDGRDGGERAPTLADPFMATFVSPATFAEAEDMLGAPLIFPTYLAPGLKLDPFATIDLDEGEQVSATLTYIRSVGLQPDDAPLEVVYLTQWKSLEYAERLRGERFDVRGTEVAIQGTLFGASTVRWRNDGRAFQMGVIATRVSWDLVRAELLRIAESMIEQG